ncbi:MAG: 16S rRNA (uracil(1498)-N(3))-methyltransferase [Rhodospirillales bacterium]|nr:16S rRNA (uracil(1498)-N(3))-methyltransferase [Rhodospirillales bacterium]
MLEMSLIITNGISALLKPKARLFVESPLGDGLCPDLTPGQAHYLRNVMRMEPGNAVITFNGKDGEWLAEVATLGKKNGSLKLINSIRPQGPEPDIWLLFAPIKKTRIDFLVEKATELGVSSLHPVITKRTIVSRVNLERMKANVLEASEQCERLTLPTLVEPQPLAQTIASWSAERTLYVLDETGNGKTIQQTILDAKGPAALLIGPEGGFAPEELQALLEKPFVTSISLGPRILRADTAAVAALACWQALAGDWQ